MIKAMPQLIGALVPACLLALVLSISPVNAEEWVDLTHPLSSDSVFWPTAEPFELRTDFEGQTDKGYFYSAYTFTTAEHGGTHIDAPIHFAVGAHRVNEIPLDRLIGEGVVLDLREVIKDSCDFLVAKEHIVAWEKAHGRIPDQSIVLLHTGFSRFWPDAESYLGTDLRGQEGVAALCFPGLHPDAATWLAEERNIKSIGIDTASIDYGQSRFYQAHVNLMTRNIPAFENVTNLDQLPPTGAYIVALPIKIEGGSGGPLRIVARLPASP